MAIYALQTTFRVAHASRLGQNLKSVSACYGQPSVLGAWTKPRPWSYLCIDLSHLIGKLDKLFNLKIMGN